MELQNEFVLNVIPGDEIYATGLVVQLTVEQVGAGRDVRPLFSRWASSQAMCEIAPPPPMDGTVESVQRFRTIDLSQVGGTLLGGRVVGDDDGVALITNFTPYGPYGEKVARYMKQVKTITLRPRYLIADGLVVGLPAWDLVLPENWEAVAGLTEGYYNTPDHPAFVAALAKIHALAQHRQVSYSLEYVECQDAWYFTVGSIAKSENFVGKELPLCLAVNDIIEHFEELGKGNESA